MKSKGTEVSHGQSGAPPALPLTRESEAYSAGYRAAQQGRVIDEIPEYADRRLQEAWEDGWTAEWADYLQIGRRCSECGAAADNWPDDSGGLLCQMCWESASADLFWEMFAALPGSWAEPAEAPSGAPPKEAA